jgi:predicted amidohydrolase YtcJ
MGIIFFSVLAIFAQAQTPAPDLILLNGRVFTAAETSLYAEAIAIQGDRVIAVGSNQQVSSLAGAATRTIDVSGRLIIPGLNDVHTHFPVGEFEGTFLQFGDDASTARVLDSVKTAARQQKAGTLIAGMISGDVFLDPALSAASLDRVAPKHPVVLFTGTPHAGILNTAAAKKVGVHPNDPPPLGGFFGKDMKSAKWDGAVHEGAWFGILLPTLLTDHSHEQERLRRFLQSEARWGVTSVTGMEPFPAQRLEVLSSIDPPIRVRLVPMLPYQDGIRRRHAEYPPVPKPIADHVTISGVKWLLDGTGIERSSAMREPYTDAPNTSGRMNFPPDELRGILNDARKDNVQPMLHTVGDQTAATLLDEMEQTGGSSVWRSRRLRIEHASCLMPDLIPHAAQLGAIVVVEPHTSSEISQLAIKRLGSARAARCGLLGSFMKAGIPVVIATDSVVDSAQLNPFANIMDAVTYLGNPGEAITREQALIAYTRMAAYAEFAESEKGTIEAGKLADVAVLSQDIFAIPAAEIPKTESVLTIVGGRIAYDSRVLK